MKMHFSEFDKVLMFTTLVLILLFTFNLMGHALT